MELSNEWFHIAIFSLFEGLLHCFSALSISFHLEGSVTISSLMAIISNKEFSSMQKLLQQGTYGVQVISFKTCWWAICIRTQTTSVCCKWDLNTPLSLCKATGSGRNGKIGITSFKLVILLPFSVNLFFSNGIACKLWVYMQLNIICLFQWGGCNWGTKFCKSELSLRRY